VNLVILGWAARTVSPLNPMLVIGVIALDLILALTAIDGGFVTGSGDPDAAAS
jgi:hypothetical protein